MKKIILIIMVLVLIPTTLADINIRVINEIEDNVLLRIDKDNIDLNETLLGYNFIQGGETLVFYYDVDDYKRRGNITYKIRKVFEASLDKYVILNCLNEFSNEECRESLINGEEDVDIMGEGISPMTGQFNNEMKNIRRNIGKYQNELREEENPFVDSLNGLGDLFGGFGN